MIYFFIMIVGIILFFFSNQFAVLLFFLFAMPFHNFSFNDIPDPYNYSDNKSWFLVDSIHPRRNEVPYENLKGKSTAVFFIHPTTYFSRGNWNQPRENEKSIKLIRERIIPNQVTVFFRCCDVYLPKYRQANIYSFIGSQKNSKRAFEIAYDDIRKSFAYFDKHYRKGRPFIIASHSQGTMHANKLLKELSGNQAIISDFVIGYLVGYKVTQKSVHPLPICQDNTEIGCIVGWNTIIQSGFKIFNDKDLVCINPLSWKEDEDFVSRQYNLGSMGFSGWFGQTILGKPALFPIEENLVGARCNGGSLEVETIDSNHYPVRLFALHAYDYGLFFKNIEKNVDDRIHHFFGKQF